MNTPHKHPDLPAAEQGVVDTSGSSFQASQAKAQDRRRQELLRLVCRHFCRNNAAELARRIDKTPNYINRCLWPPDKAGHKGIGTVLMDAVSDAFPVPQGFWAMEPRQAELALDGLPAAMPAAGSTRPLLSAAAVPSPIARALIEKLMAVAGAGRLPEERALEWLGELVRLEN